MIKKGDIVKFKHRLWIVVENPADGKAYITLAKNQSPVWTGYKYLDNMRTSLKNLKLKDEERQKTSCN